MQRMTTLLRKRLANEELLVLPGCYDAISARITDANGFDAAYMTGGGTAYGLGFPDYGLATMTEMVRNAGVIANSIGIPLIADADTGYGNELNVTRTVREFTMAGVAAIHLEDQEFPKRCGHHDDKRVIAQDAYVSKIRAAVAAKIDPDFLIIARTDARASLGLDAAIERANAALEAGADMAFVEAPQSIDEMEAIPRGVRGPCMLNVAWNSKTPDIGASEVAAMGYRAAIFPGVMLWPAIATLDRAARELKETGRHAKPDVSPELTHRIRHGGMVDWENIRKKADHNSGT